MTESIVRTTTPRIQESKLKAIVAFLWMWPNLNFYCVVVSTNQIYKVTVQTKL